MNKAEAERQRTYMVEWLARRGGEVSAYNRSPYALTLLDRLVSEGLAVLDDGVYRLQAKEKS